MSTRFYAGPVSNGMGRSREDWDEPESIVEARLRRWRASVVRPHGSLPILAAPPPDSPHQRADAILPHR